MSGSFDPPPPKLSRDFLSFSQNDFLSGEYHKTAVLASTTKVWISALDTKTSVSYRLPGSPPLFWVSLLGDKFFFSFFLRRLSPKLGSQDQLRIKPLPSEAQRHENAAILKARKRCDFFRSPKNRSFSAIFWRFFFAIPAGKLANLPFAIWKRSDFSAIAIFWD